MEQFPKIPKVHAESLEESESNEKTRGPLRLKQAIAVGALSLLASCEDPVDLSTLYNKLETGIVSTEDTVNSFYERLWLDNKNMVAILDTLENGVLGDPFEKISSDLKGLSTEGKNEFSFALYQDESGVWRITALNQGTDQNVRIDSLEMQVSRLGGKKLISVHNHPLETGFAVDDERLTSDDQYSSQADQNEEFLIKSMREEVIKPLPMPPSASDLISCAKQTKEISTTGVEYSCAVASGDGVWRVSIPVEQAEVGMKTLSEERGAYVQQHRYLFTQYSDEATRGIQNGNLTQYEVEYAEKQKHVAMMVKMMEDAGFQVELQTYK